MVISDRGPKSSKWYRQKSPVLQRRAGGSGFGIVVVESVGQKVLKVLNGFGS